MKHLDRRTFLRQSLAGSLTLGFSLQGPGLIAKATAAQVFDPTGFEGDWAPSIFVSLAKDGAITIVAHRSEMGTGIGTALPMVLADEMDAAWEDVRIVQADGDRKYGSQNTDGSRSIREFYERMRVVGATVRRMLILAAADLDGGDPTDYYAKDSSVRRKGSQKAVPFGALVEKAAEFDRPAREDLVFKKPEERSFVGKETAVPLRDMDAILDGSAHFGLDLRLPEMRYAVIARCPVLGGKAVKWDEAAALAVPGVEQVIAVEGPPAEGPYLFNALGGVAVIARDTWAAIQGRDKLAIAWDEGPHASWDSEEQVAGLRASVDVEGQEVRANGDIEAGLKEGRLVEAEYALPHLAHAPMETPCATAVVHEDSAEIWMPTQTPQSARQNIAQNLGMEQAQVAVHVTLLGGGFGRKSKPDYGVEAALLAKEVGKPVQLLWTREDDIRHGYFHAVSAMRFSAALDAGHRPTALRARTAFTPIAYTFSPAMKRGTPGECDLGLTDMPFDIPNLKVETGDADPHLRIGWLRSVCNVFHAHGVGCFADELAAEAGADPLDYLLDLIGEPRQISQGTLGGNYSNYGGSLEEQPVDTGRLRAVLERVAANADWKSRRAALAGTAKPWKGIGLAVHRSFLGYVANTVEVEISESGVLSIPRVHIALDCGLAIHPDRVRAQMEGAAVFGVSLAKYGKITGKDGRVEQSNFHDYPVARMSDAPGEIHVDLMQNESMSTGVGEVGVPPFAPALLNAIFDATGVRHRTLPLSDLDLRPA